MQVLSCSSAGVLVAISGLLLRSQALISGARSPNFETKDPSVESSDVSPELAPIIVLLIMLLSAPAIIAFLLGPMSRFKRSISSLRENPNDSALGASVQVTGADVRLCFKPLTRRWQMWRSRKVAPAPEQSVEQLTQQEKRAAAVLASAAIAYSKKELKISV